MGRQDRHILPVRDFPHSSRKKMVSFWPYNKFDIDLACSVKTAVYSLANIEPLWPHAWSIMHVFYHLKVLLVKDCLTVPLQLFFLLFGKLALAAAIHLLDSEISDRKSQSVSFTGRKIHLHWRKNPRKKLMTEVWPFRRNHKIILFLPCLLPILKVKFSFQAFSHSWEQMH